MNYVIKKCLPLVNQLSFLTLVTATLLIGFSDKQVAAQSNAAALSEITNFRVDTDIYSDLSEPPIKRSMTLFSGGVYYDFDIDLNQITMIDPAREQIVLFNRNEQIRCQIACGRLLDSMAKADAQLSPQQRLLLKDADITVNDNENRLLKIGNQRIFYRCEYRVLEDTNVARQYFNFANWSARLNAIFSAKMPPFVRMQLNDELLQRNAIPSLITRGATEGNREQEISAKLIYSDRLSADDQASITRVGTMLVQFKEVSVTEFMRVQSNITHDHKTAASNDPSQAKK